MKLVTRLRRFAYERDKLRWEVWEDAFDEWQRRTPYSIRNGESAPWRDCHIPPRKGSV